ncbi:zinc-ribbon domain-containing protein [Desulfobacterium sp. N47]|uniref:Zinc finger/thioredoxin putative domain-containing protein n=1 Tax=uncultured Desulfobacterium sp. TaxID=201089 RepID=E1YFZ3_9BACT|nr:hypothetical protein N47_J04680 [uncultured Desulfobacterium sp.]
MDITCDKCNGKFRISDEKIPAELKSIACPKCKNKIPINTTVKDEDINFDQQDEPPALKSGKENLSFDEAVTSDSYDAADKPFDFIEEEGKTALICESDPEFIKIILETLNLMEFTMTVAKNGRDVIKKMRYHVYDTIVLNEKFDNANPDANPIMFNLERLPISTRRNIFVALLSDRFRTMDNMTAFQKSVNIIINSNNMKDFGKIFSRGLTDHEFFYKVFRDVMKKIGRV